MPNTYNVYFGFPEDLIQIAEEQLELEIVVPYALEYNTIYNWRVDTVTETEIITGDIWSFTAILFYPPFPSGVTLDYGEDPPVPTGIPTGVNNMVTIKRIVVAADSKIFYET